MTRLLAQRRPDGLLVPVAIRGDDGLLRPAGEGCTSTCCSCDHWFIATECPQSIPNDTLCEPGAPQFWAVRCDHPYEDGTLPREGDVVLIAPSRCATLSGRFPVPPPGSTPIDPKGPPLVKIPFGCDDFRCAGPPGMWIRGVACNEDRQFVPDVYVCPHLVPTCGVYRFDFNTDPGSDVNICYYLDPAAAAPQVPPPGAFLVKHVCPTVSEPCIYQVPQTCCECNNCFNAGVLIHPCTQEEIGRVCCDPPEDQFHTSFTQFDDVTETCSGVGCGGGSPAVISRTRIIQTIQVSGTAGQTVQGTYTTRTIHTDFCDASNNFDTTVVAEIDYFFQPECPVRAATGNAAGFVRCPDENCSVSITRTATSFVCEFNCVFPQPTCVSGGGGQVYSVSSRGIHSHTVDRVDGGGNPDCDNVKCPEGSGPVPIPPGSLPGSPISPPDATRPGLDLGSGLGGFL